MENKIVTIHQPQYIPWVPYLNKVLNSDLFVLLDNVQFQKNGLQNRNQIKTQHGAQWLTIPVKQSSQQLIQETQIADVNIIPKHLKTLDQNYKKSRYYHEIIELIRPVSECTNRYLIDLNEAIIRNILDYLEFKGALIRASALKVNGNGSDLILNICKAVDAHTYISGSGGRNYMQLIDFEEAGIVVKFQDCRLDVYPQLFSQHGFIKGLSVVDLLFNCGKSGIEIIKSAYQI